MNDKHMRYLERAQEKALMALDDAEVVLQGSLLGDMPPSLQADLRLLTEIRDRVQRRKDRFQAASNLRAVG